MSLPSTFSAITSGTQLIGKTVTLSTNSWSRTPNGKIIFEFNNSNNLQNSTTAAIFGPYRSPSGYFAISYKESTGSIVTTQTTFIPQLALYIYTIYFISQTQIEYKIYNMYQLLTVLPKTSIKAIPKLWRPIITNHVFNYLYPTQFNIKTLYKRYYHDCYPILPKLEKSLYNQLKTKVNDLLSII